MADVTVFGSGLSTYVRTARLALHEKGVPYELKEIDFSTIHSPAHRALHPFEKVPAFQHGDFRLYETIAIARYVDEAFPGPALQPGTPAQRARMTQWLSCLNAYFYPTMIVECVLERLAPRLFSRPSDEAKVRAAAPKIEYQLGVLDQALAEHPYLAGPAVSLADLLLVPVTTYLWGTPEGETVLPKVPRVRAWQERMASRPSFAATQPQM